MGMSLDEIRQRAADIRARGVTPPTMAVLMPVVASSAAMAGSAVTSDVLAAAPVGAAVGDATAPKAKRPRKAKVDDAAPQASDRRRPRKSKAPPIPAVVPAAPPPRRGLAPFVARLPASAPAAPSAASGGLALTEEQNALIDAARRLRAGELEAVRAIAFAGAGKTFTAKQIASKAFGGLPGLYLAFGRAIADEAKSSFPATVTVKTANGLAWGALGLKCPANEKPLPLNGRTVLQIVGDDAEEWANGPRVLRQASWVAKVITAYCQSADRDLGPQHMTGVLDYVYRPRHGAPADNDAKAFHEAGMALRQLAQQVLDRHVTRCLDWFMDWRRNRVLPPHEIYLKAFELDDELVLSTTSRYAYIILDEAQDLNPVQRSIAVKSKRPLIAIGDPWQQIYSWRGAEDALEHLPGPRLPLSQSFRFGEAIAALAREVLASKPEGAPTVPLRGNPNRQSTVQYAMDDAIEPGAVVCRSNAGVFKAAVTAARQQLKVHVAGGIRDLEEEVRSAVALYEGYPDEVSVEHLRRFRTWADLRSEAKDLDDPALTRLADAVEKGNLVRDLALLHKAHVASPDAADVVCSTCHKAKGLEWSTVTLWDDWPSADKRLQRYYSALDAADPELVKAALEEWHTYYVAVTRGVDRLILMPTD